MRHRPGRVRLAVAVVLATTAAAARADLRADELLLLVNSRVPQSLALAEQYAKARGVPAGRILKLDTETGEDLSFDQYNATVAKPVRDYLATPAGTGVRCLVTFFGLPLRVGAQPANADDPQELQRLRKAMADLDAAAPRLAQAMDDAAKTIGVTPADSPTNGVWAARQHIAETERRVQSTLTSTPDPAKQAAVVEQFKAAQRQSVAAALAALGTGPTTLPADLQSLLTRQRDAAARQALRQAVAQQAGVFALYQILEQQVLLIDTTDSDAAVDSELALVRLPDFARYRWQINSLNYKTPGNHGGLALMVSRIDAPTAEMASKMIEDTLAVEAAGLTGKAVFDSRGLSPMKDGKPDGYGVFDQSVRDAAAFVRAKTKLMLVTDDREALIAPRDVPGTALYCGWYSVRQYIPSCLFVRGAVAYHVASYELISMHQPREKGWVPNLIKEGVVATLGAVAEPYLSAFPRPDEFYPLLLTGKPTLAEAYWATCPMTSWKMVLIGDPLYRPYAKTPAISDKDLPAPLAAWLTKSEAARPAGR